jgi:hypothetical protein
MEASEKPQQELDLADGAVRALDDRLVIESLTVSDARAARVVRERAEAGQAPPQTVSDAIEIGARVLDREGTEAEADYVRREFERVSAEARRHLVDQARGVTESIERQFERAFADEGGALGRALDGFEGELSEQIAQHFDVERAGAVPNQVKEIVAKIVEERMQGLVRHLSSEDGSNPLADFKSGVNRTVIEAVRHLKEEEKATRSKLEGLQQEVVRLTEQTEAKRQLAEAEDVGTRKGRTFEERVHAALDRIATARGDTAHHVGNEPGAGGTKKGDAVVEVGAAEGPCMGRIVFEAKDEQLSKNRAWAELDAAMAERQAEFAVLVVAGDQSVPAGREQLAEYEGNKIIVAVDPERPDELGLDLAYRYARLRLMLRREGQLELDAAGVRDAAEQARSVLKNAQSIRLALTNADKSVSRAREGVDDLVASMDAQLGHIESLVGASDQPD